MNQGLTIALGDADGTRRQRLVDLLRSRGHEVSPHSEAREVLSAPEPDVYLIGSGLEDGSSGLDLLASLRGAGRMAPVVLFDEKPTFEQLSRAVELGAADFLLRPGEGDEVLRAIERAGSLRRPKARADVEPSQLSSGWSYEIGDQTVGRAAREVSAFLVNERVATPHRVRIASALAEIVDNACRHAYRDSSGRVQVEARIQGNRVQVEVVDLGSGFDSALAQLERIPPALPGRRRGGSGSSTGLGRVERLCEGLTVDSGPGGTRVEMTFELTPVRLQDESEDLAATDFLDPSRARSLITALRDDAADLSRVAPAMALTIGRILGGIDASDPARGKEPKWRR